MPRVPYILRNIRQPLPGFQETTIWRPYLRARVHVNESVSPHLDLLVDSGSDLCLLDAAIGEALGLDFSRREASPVAVMDVQGHGFAQNVLISTDGGEFRTRILFVQDLPVPGLLGRRGFFDNFRVTFDHSTQPPSLLYERIVRA